MGGRGGQGRFLGGHSGRRSRGRGTRRDHYNSTLNKNKGLCSALGNKFYDYGQKGAADQMQTTWEKIFHHVGNIYGHNISNKIQYKTKVSIPKP